jgi:4-azaleucine resistance transporter AzlC
MSYVIENYLMAQTMQNSPNLRYFYQSLPVLLGYIPLSFACGVMMQSSGLSAFNMLWMTMMVYAASSQIAAINMFLNGAASITIVATVGIINMRHLLMASVLSPKLSALRGWKRWLFAFQLTDESFAIHSLGFSRPKPPSPQALFLVNFGLQAAWLFGALCSLFVKTDGQIDTLIGLDYTPLAMFIALLVLIIQSPEQLLGALFTGCFATMLRKMGWVGWDIMVASLIGATLAFGGSKWIKAKSFGSR